MLMANNKPKVLVIDDDISLLKQIRYRLVNHENLTVIEAENGLSGVAQASSDHPDLIILDWMLPDIQGPEVLHQLKSHNQTRQIPVLMLSGKNKIGNIEDAFELGIDAYLTKPFRLQSLAKKVTELLNSSTRK